MTNVIWFRRDLRLRDNPALKAAAEEGEILPLYILEEGANLRPIGGASRWWLHHSLEHLESSLGGMEYAHGEALGILRELAQRSGARTIHWNRCLDANGEQRDYQLATELREEGVDVVIHDDGYLFRPEEMRTGAGGPFKVFSPFWKACQTRQVMPPVEAPEVSLSKELDHSLGLADLQLLPRSPDWAQGWCNLWQPGELGAKSRLEQFIKTGLPGYGSGRDRPDQAHVSRLSAHLHFGEISPRQVWARMAFAQEARPELARDIAKFQSELGWREFSHQLLYHYPDLAEKNWRPGFDHYPWRDDPRGLVAWQRGMTGYPIVDAGMRELWQTGYMHNRVRMVAASFLIKHLRIDWRAGERWFWDTLVDADAANNAASWQWVAGSGADAAPYFRIFNPMTQGRKFDPDGTYVRRWCPELKRLDNRFIHAPFEASPMELEMAGIRLGRDYPNPIVDHAAARQAALSGYDRVKAAG
ncbi:cryptochrome/photolyase family protein [Aestuariispira insulae]|uniref:Deoxyribodipyrimidine photo-lyase n=1 Tax=Aestuariispira insulae TaxID=1461337 RepID=A0A3D9HVF5_9PROT|nr:deoxyribodipyrimidine photo-lyase [Aestuariispira insulae]RED53420.1 deoxyribodipyrimidine photo-lyase [Aestuariispira insulae]